jgi:hypothetical protein
MSADTLVIIGLTLVYSAILLIVIGLVFIIIAASKI